MSKTKVVRKISSPVQSTSSQVTLEKALEQSVKETLHTFLQPICDYLEENYDINEDVETLSNVTCNYSKPTIKRGPLAGTSTRSRSQVKKNIPADEDRCNYKFNEGKDSEYRCEEKRQKNGKYCNKCCNKRKVKQELEGNGNKGEGNSEGGDCSLKRDEKLKVSSKVGFKVNTTHKLYIHKDKYLIINDDDNKINVLCKIEKDEDVFLIFDLNNADMSYFKRFDDILFKDCDYFLNEILEDEDKKDMFIKTE